MRRMVFGLGAERDPHGALAISDVGGNAIKRPIFCLNVVTDIRVRADDFETCMRASIFPGECRQERDPLVGVNLLGRPLI